MKEIKTSTLEDFYKECAIFTGKSLDELFPNGMQKDIGHFNVFNIKDTIAEVKRTSVMPYNRRSYYKISLIRGKNRAEYADKVIDIEENALLFATPKVPYHYIPQEGPQNGKFCVFTADFLLKSKIGIELDDLPIFAPGAFPIFTISHQQANELEEIFIKIQKEINSDYPFKYDLIRNLVMELIHYGQKLQPALSQNTTSNASTRVSSLFIELLERQFPIETPNQQLQLRTAKDFADRLSIHVNHLNKVLKEVTGSTTTNIISNRIIQEAKILLKQTDWNISEIAWSLGFEEVAHFSNFFKKHVTLAPVSFRS